MTLVYSPIQIIAKREREGRLGLLVKHESWDRVEIGQFARILNGAPFKSNAFNSDQFGMPLIRIRDVGRDQSDTYYSGDYEDLHVVHPGSILVGMDGDFRVAVWNGPMALLNQRVCRIDITNPIMNPALLPLMLQPYLDAVWEETSAVTVKHLSSKTISAIPLPIPPADEQDEIVRILDTQLARLNSVLGAVQTIREKAAQFRRSLLRDAFNGQLTQPDPSRATTLPDGWRLSKFGEVFKVRYGKALSKDLRLEEGPFPVVGSAGVMAHTSTALATEPSIVIGRKGNVGESRYFPNGCWPIDTTYFVYVTTDHSGRFIELLLEAHDLRHLDSSTTTPSLRRQDLEAVEIQAPPIDEQDEIVSVLDAQLSRLDDVLRVADRVEVECGRLRRSLLQAAFSGELTREWRESHV